MQNEGLRNSDLQFVAPQCVGRCPGPLFAEDHCIRHTGMFRWDHPASLRVSDVRNAAYLQQKQTDLLLLNSSKDSDRQWTTV